MERAFREGLTERITSKWEPGKTKEASQAVVQGKREQQVQKSCGWSVPAVFQSPWGGLEVGVGSGVSQETGERR